MVLLKKGTLNIHGHNIYIPTYTYDSALTKQKS